MKIKVTISDETRLEATIAPQEFGQQLQVCVSLLGRTIAKAKAGETGRIEVTREASDGELTP